MKKEFLPKQVYYIFGCMAIIALIIPFIIYRIQFYGSLSSNSDEWNNFGGYYGGVVGPILNFLSVILILITIILQNEANNLQRINTENSLSSIQSNSVLLERQISNVALQRFESSFSSSLNQRFLIFDTFKNGNKEGSQIFRDDIESIIKNYFISKYGDVKTITVGNNTGIMKYIGLFNYIVILANSIIYSVNDENDRTHYFDILRYSLTESELSLLVISKYSKELSEKYLNTIDTILGEYSIITLDELSRTKNNSLYFAALEKGILRIKI